jgi:hypothetical protein
MTSALLVILTMRCLQTAYGSMRALKVWIDGLRPSLVGPLQFVRGSVERLVSFVLGVVELLHYHVVPRGRGGVGNV